MPKTKAVMIDKEALFIESTEELRDYLRNANNKDLREMYLAADIEVDKLREELKDLISLIFHDDTNFYSSDEVRECIAEYYEKYGGS